MNKYILTSKNLTGEILYGYNTEGELIYFEIKAELDEARRKWIFAYFPVREEQIEKLKTFKTVQVANIPPDLSFNAFWGDYNYKIGNKKRCEKLWNELNDAERTLVLKSLPKYDFFLKMKNGQAKVYPETFLSQHRWENDYSIK